MSTKMEAADAANAALEALARAKGSLSAPEIAASAELEDHEARAAVGLLRNANLLVRESRGSGFAYAINPELNAFDLIKAAEMGVSIDPLTEKNGVSAKRKQEALALSAQAGKIKEMDAQRQAEKAARSKQTTPITRDAVTASLEVLIDAAGKSMGKVKGKGKDKAALAEALSRAKEQAASALEDHRRTIGNERKE